MGEERFSQQSSAYLGEFSPIKHTFLPMSIIIYIHIFFFPIKLSYTSIQYMYFHLKPGPSVTLIQCGETDIQCQVDNEFSREIVCIKCNYHT